MQAAGQYWGGILLVVDACEFVRKVGVDVGGEGLVSDLVDCGLWISGRSPSVSIAFSLCTRVFGHEPEASRK